MNMLSYYGPMVMFEYAFFFIVPHILVMATIICALKKRRSGLVVFPPFPASAVLSSILRFVLWVGI